MTAAGSAPKKTRLTHADTRTKSVEAQAQLSAESCDNTVHSHTGLGQQETGPDEAVGVETLHVRDACVRLGSRLSSALKGYGMRRAFCLGTTVKAAVKLRR